MLPQESLLGLRRIDIDAEEFDRHLLAYFAIRPLGETNLTHASSSKEALNAVRPVVFINALLDIVPMAEKRFYFAADLRGYGMFGEIPLPLGLQLPARAWKIC